ncbi:hypothetical protein BOTNAR_1012g00020 [Botryotinia narcissicola]|uniref:Uncharacterized protein n=1 Tax=Botryotinia narcissicola TaxID=278944 RepID=A0A4Z1H476_9HELO|nr:hypothetical protein BOTNAR_1012g00020 [Botryotinia narcissicola]
MHPAAKTSASRFVLRQKYSSISSRVGTRARAREKAWEKLLGILFSLPEPLSSLVVLNTGTAQQFLELVRILAGMELKVYLLPDDRSVMTESRLGVP